MARDVANGQEVHSKLKASLRPTSTPITLQISSLSHIYLFLELEKSESMFLYEQGLDARDRFEGSFRASSVTNICN